MDEAKTTKQSWTRDQKIQLGQVVVTGIGVIIAVVIAIIGNNIHVDLTDIKAQSAEIDTMKARIGKIEELSGNTARFQQFVNDYCYIKMPDGTIKVKEPPCN
ncbi:MAG: hypothetical protein AAB417_03520 [Patescibacteria group bacterium]